MHFHHPSVLRLTAHARIHPSARFVHPLIAYYAHGFDWPIPFFLVSAISYPKPADD